MTSSTSSEFERLSHDFLAKHASLRHEWKPIKDRLWGNRLELVFAPASTSVPEVWVSLMEGQIAVGAGEAHKDFESFGRRISDNEVAQEAFDHLAYLLRQHGYDVD